TSEVDPASPERVDVERCGCVGDVDSPGSPLGSVTGHSTTCSPGGTPSFLAAVGQPRDLAEQHTDSSAKTIVLAHGAKPAAFPFPELGLDESGEACPPSTKALVGGCMR